MIVETRDQLTATNIGRKNASVILHTINRSLLYLKAAGGQ